MEAATTSPVVERIAPSGLMTTEQAAEYLTLKPATLMVWRSTNRKKLAFVKIGGNGLHCTTSLSRINCS